MWRQFVGRVVISSKNNQSEQERADEAYGKEKADVVEISETAEEAPENSNVISKD